MTPLKPLSLVTTSSQSHSISYGLTLASSPKGDILETPHKSPLKACPFYAVYEAAKVAKLTLNLKHFSKKSATVSEADPIGIYVSKTEWVDEELKTIAAPSDEGLMLMASYYNSKYSIPIQITGSYESLYNALLGRGISGDFTTWGVIATTGLETNHHVTPLICLKTDPGVVQIAVLDSVSSPILDVLEALSTLQLKEEKVKIFYINSRRQSDDIGCRTDALVILKDALRDLRSKKVTNLMAFLNVKFDGTNFGFSLPYSWSKTVQVPCAQLGDVKDLVLNKKGESFEAFISRFSRPAIRSRSSLLCYTAFNGSKKEIAETSNQEKIARTYLNYKGKKIAAKMEALIKAEEVSIMMGYSFLKGLYKKA
jgi:hypothetical protein